jgi:hypothetical protein
MAVSTLDQRTMLPTWTIRGGELVSKWWNKKLLENMDRSITYMEGCLLDYDSS